MTEQNNPLAQQSDSDIVRNAFSSGSTQGAFGVEMMRRLKDALDRQAAALILAQRAGSLVAIAALLLAAVQVGIAVWQGWRSAPVSGAWVLWLEARSLEAEPLDPPSWHSMTGAWSTRTECEAERQRLDADVVKALAEYRRRMKEEHGEDVPRETGRPTSRLLCLPDTVDPRAPKTGVR